MASPFSGLDEVNNHFYRVFFVIRCLLFQTSDDRWQRPEDRNIRIRILDCKILSSSFCFWFNSFNSEIRISSSEFVLPCPERPVPYSLSLLPFSINTRNHCQQRSGSGKILVYPHI